MKKPLTMLLAMILGIAIILGGVGCGNRSNITDTSDGTNQDTEIKESLTLSVDSVELKVNEQYLLIATVNPSITEVVWSSTNESVATVNSNGLVTAFAEGTTIIKATTTTGKSTDTCVVKVVKEEQQAQPISIFLSKTQLDLDVGDTYLLSAMVTPSDSNTQISWTSTNEAVVTVNNGLLTGVSAGTAFIQAEADGATAVCTVEVKEVFGSISGTITCRNTKTNKDEVDVTTKIYLISYGAVDVNLVNIMYGRDYNYPDRGIYSVSVNSAGAYSFTNLKPGKYRMIVVCDGSYFRVDYSSVSSLKSVLGSIFEKGTDSSKNSIESTTSKTTYRAQMSGFDVNVGKTPLIITRNIYGQFSGVNV